MFIRAARPLLTGVLVVVWSGATSAGQEIRTARISITRAFFAGNAITGVEGTGEILDEEKRSIAKAKLTMLDGWIAVQVRAGTKFRWLPALDTQGALPRTWPGKVSKKIAKIALHPDGQWEVMNDCFFFLVDVTYGARPQFAASFARGSEISIPGGRDLSLWGNRVRVGTGGGTIRVAHGRIVGGTNFRVIRPKASTRRQPEVDEDDEP